MKKIAILMMILILIPVMAFASENSINGVVDWKNGVVQATGIGYPPSNAMNPAQGIAMARRAALLDAYRNLLENVNGVQVDSETTVSNLNMYDTIHAKLSGVIRGANVVHEENLPDGTYKVTVEVKLFGDNSVAQAVIPQNNIAQPLPEPSKPILQTSNPVSIMPVYTGVVIDARGLGLDRVMSPLVYDDKGRVIYGNKYIDTAFVIKNGMVDYLTEDTINEIGTGKSRAGENPLIIKAISVKDFNRNIVISEDDANKILVANQNTGFLQRTSVIFEQ